MDKPARSPLVRSFERHLRSTNRSESTIATYLIGLVFLGVASRLWWKSGRTRAPVDGMLRGRGDRLVDHLLEW